MVIRGRLADILIRIAPQVYKKVATNDKQENTVLYVKLLKALYGLMEASLLFYQKLLKDHKIQLLQDLQGQFRKILTGLVRL